MSGFSEQYSLQKQHVSTHQAGEGLALRSTEPNTESEMTARRLATHLGFRTRARGTLTSRTIMLAELTTLLAFVPAAASKAEHRSAIIAENVLGKKTTSTRK